MENTCKSIVYTILFDDKKKGQILPIYVYFLMVNNDIAPTIDPVIENIDPKTAFYMLFVYHMFCTLYAHRNNTL